MVKGFAVWKAKRSWACTSFMMHQELGVEVAELRRGHGPVDARVDRARAGAEQQADGGGELSDGGGGDGHGPG